MTSTGKVVILSIMKALKLLALLLIGIQITAQDVYKTPSGEKYHLATCRMVKNVSEKISVPKAKLLGLEACKICKPHNIYSLALISADKESGQGKSVQCKGITKAGSRCKHMTRIATVIVSNMTLIRIDHCLFKVFHYLKTLILKTHDLYFSISVGRGRSAVFSEVSN